MNVPVFLEYSDGFFLHTEHDDVLATNADGSRALLHCFLSVFNLEEATIRREDCDRRVVFARHFNRFNLSEEKSKGDTYEYDCDDIYSNLVHSLHIDESAVNDSRPVGHSTVVLTRNETRRSIQLMLERNRFFIHTSMVFEAHQRMDRGREMTRDEVLRR